MNEQKMRDAFEAWCRSGDGPALFNGGVVCDDDTKDLLRHWMECTWIAVTSATKRDAMAVAEAVYHKTFWSCREGDGEVDLSAIVEAALPGQQEPVNQQLLAALKALLGRYVLAIGNEGIECHEARAAIAAAEAAQPVVPIASKFFAYDENVGFDLFDTAEEAKKAAQDSIDEYRHEAGEGWPDEVDNVCWGVVLGATKEAPLVDSEGNSTDLAGDRYVDYVLTDCQHPSTAQQQGEPVAYITNDGRQLIFADRAEEFSTLTDMRPLIYGDTAPPAPACSVPDGGICAECAKSGADGFALYCVGCIDKHALAVPDGYVLVRNPITEEMHRASVKVLHRSHGIDGLPQQMLDAMLAVREKGGHQ